MPSTDQAGQKGNDGHLREAWHFVQRNWPIILGVPVMVIAATALFTSFTPRVYEGLVTIRIDENRSNLPVLDALRTLSAGGSELETEMEVLRSRTVAEQVVADLGLHLELSTPRRTPRSELFAAVDMGRDAPAGRYRLERQGSGTFVAYDRGDRRVGEAAPGERLMLPGGSVVLTRAAADFDEITLRVRRFDESVRRFRRTLAVTRPNREADIVVARYEAQDPLLAQQVPNTVAAAFMALRGESRGAEARSTVRFLHEQIDTLTQQLAAAEQTLRVFREREGLVSPEAQAGAQVERLVELKAQRDMVAAEAMAMTTLLRQVEATPLAEGYAPSPTRRLMAFPTLLRNPATAELLRSLTEVENQRSQLLHRRTEDDPYEVAVFTQRVREIEQQLASIGATYLDGLTNQVASLDVTLGTFADELARIPAAEIEFMRLRREAKVLEEIYTLLQTRLKESEIVAAADDPTVRVVDPAIVPFRPIRPNVPLSLALAVVLGVMLGTGTAFVREHLDTRIRTRDDLQAALGGAAVLGTIPRIREQTTAERRFRLLPGTGARESAAETTPAWRSAFVAGLDPRSPVSEAYRSLRTNISFARPGEAPRIIVFTSPAPGDGKSTSAVNLAAMLARQNSRCLLVDADMRRGRLHETLGESRQRGLSEVLLGRCALEEGVRRIQVGDDAHFDLLPTGTLPPNPAELVGAGEMQKLLERLRQEYDTVLLDAPPLNVVTDAALLGIHSDGVIVVARAGVTDRNALRYALEQIRAVRAPLLGTVLNDVDGRKDSYYGAYASASY